MQKKISAARSFAKDPTGEFTDFHLIGEEGQPSQTILFDFDPECDF